MAASRLAGAWPRRGGPRGRTAAASPSGGGLFVQYGPRPHKTHRYDRGGRSAAGGAARRATPSHRGQCLVFARGWNRHPDWAGPLREAGYDVVARRQFDTAQDPAPEGTADHAAAYLGRIRTFLKDHPDAGDLATLDRLLDPRDEAGLRNRTDLRLSGTRTAWLACRA